MRRNLFARSPLRRWLLQLSLAGLLAPSAASAAVLADSDARAVPNSGKSLT
jgi:hypothetical protein